MRIPSRKSVEAHGRNRHFTCSRCRFHLSTARCDPGAVRAVPPRGRVPSVRRSGRQERPCAVAGRRCRAQSSSLRDSAAGLPARRITPICRIAGTRPKPGPHFHGLAIGMPLPSPRRSRFSAGADRNSARNPPRHPFRCPHLACELSPSPAQPKPHFPCRMASRGEHDRGDRGSGRSLRCMLEGASTGGVTHAIRRMAQTNR